jgi:hypothetical protein
MADIAFGQPAPPADDQHRLHHEFDDRDGDVDERPGREHPQQQGQNSASFLFWIALNQSRLKKDSRTEMPTCA